ncbi:alpha/beta hydrolase fold domain-containing protein [Tsukamurella soli]
MDSRRRVPDRPRERRRRLCRRFAAATGALMMSVDYRLAPEHPYPAALDGCLEAYHLLPSMPEVETDRIAVGGASAGWRACRTTDPPDRRTQHPTRSAAAPGVSDARPLCLLQQPRRPKSADLGLAIELLRVALLPERDPLGSPERGTAQHSDPAADMDRNRDTRRNFEGSADIDTAH